MDPKQEKKAFQEAKQKCSFVSKSGLPFVCFILEEAQGDLETTIKCIQQMNVPIKKKDGEVVRDISDIGKLAVSINDDQMVLVTYVPLEKKESISAADWMETIVSPYKIAYEFVRGANERVGIPGGNSSDSYDETMATAVLPNDPEANVYVFKLRDEIISQAYKDLRQLGIIKVQDESDEEELLGDDVFA